MRRSVLVAACAAFGACATAQRPLQPASTEHGALAARVALKGRELPNWITHHVDEVFWAKVNAYGDLDLDHPIRTNLSRGGDCYVLDVPPGRYALFAVAYSSLRLRFVARIDNDLRRELAVDLEPGGFAYAGELLLRTEFSGVLDMLEHAGLHVLGALPPFKRPSVDVTAGAPKLDRDLAHEAAFFKRARLALRGTLWADRVEERLAALGNPPDPVMTGHLLKRRALPSVGAETFSYVDTLKWGAPRKTPTGLEWREPKGRARVAVGFVDEAKGGKPRAQALAELKLAGETSDDHVLYEVAIDSRPGSWARYTTYVYPEDKLLGAEPRVFKTQLDLLEAKGGYYVLMYRADASDFERFFPAFAVFADHLSLRPPKKESRAVAGLEPPS